MAQLKVYHKGDEQKGIKGTGQERLMGEDQFARMKSKGWSLVPLSDKTSPKPKTGTGSDSGKDSKDLKESQTILDLNTTEGVALIKALGEKGDTVALKAIVELENTSKTPRSTILNAVEKVLKNNED